MSVSQAQSTTVFAQPAASASTQVLLNATNSRRGAYVFNGGSTTLYIAFAATATTAAYTTQIATGAGWVLDPASGYGGPISAISAGSPTGNLAVTAW